MRSLRLLLFFLVLVPGASAWAQPSMAGYVVDGAPTQTVQTAPAGWFGRKTVDSQRRASNTDETRGTEAIYTLTFGGFVRGCPTADGVVDGTFEYALTSEVRTVPGQTLHSRYSRQLVAQLRGEVGADARLIKVELFGSWSIETRAPGMPPSLQTQPVRQTFRPAGGGEPDWPSMQAAVLQTGDLSVAAVILWAGEFYKSAEVNWNKENECVEFELSPPSDQLSLGPNESAPVRVELHTKAGALPVPWETSSVQAMGGGTVSPRPARAPAGTATLTYTASSAPRRGHGIDLATTSRAGNAVSKWRITDNDGRWSGTITVIETSSSTSSGASPFDRGAHTIEETETTQVTVRVTDGVDPSGTRALATLKGRVEGRFERVKTFAGWVRDSCGSIKNRKMNNTSKETSTGSGAGDSTISVSVSVDGTYAITAVSPDVVMPIAGQVNGSLEVFRSGRQDCVVFVKTDSREHVPLQQPVSGLLQATGTVDPKAPNVLAGSKTEDLSQGDNANTRGRRPGSSGASDPIFFPAAALTRIQLDFTPIACLSVGRRLFPCRPLARIPRGGSKLEKEPL